MLGFIDNIHGLWIGELKELQIMSIKSFLSHGHRYNLWAYSDMDAPPGTNLLDADKIVPRKVYEKWMLNPYNHKLQTFANYFRYKLIHEKGGFWCDLDLVCLKALVFKQEYIFLNIEDIPLRRELNHLKHLLGPYGNIANGLFKAPSGSPMLQSLIEKIEPSAINGECPEHFGTWGAVEFSKSVVDHQLLSHKKKGLIEYGYAYAERQYDDPHLNLPDSHTIHFWNYLGGKKASHNSLYDRMKRKYI
jgi:hypothetical protein